MFPYSEPILIVFFARLLGQTEVSLRDVMASTQPYTVTLDLRQERQELTVCTSGFLSSMTIHIVLCRFLCDWQCCLLLHVNYKLFMASIN